jgi:hypothetical protein
LPNIFLANQIRNLLIITIAKQLQQADKNVDKVHVQAQSTQDLGL